MSEKRYEVDGVEVERYMLVFGDEGTRIVDNQTGKELYAIELVDLLNELSTNCSQLQEENEQLRLELETHKHPLRSTREAERKLSEVTNNLANEIKKNGLLNEEINQLRIENMRLKKKGGDGV